MKKFLLTLLTFGMYDEGFDRRAFVRKNFPHIFDILSIQDDKQAIEARNATIRMSTDNAESLYYVRVANRRITVIAIISMLVALGSVLVGLVSIKVTHDDSVSTTKALVEALNSCK